MWKALVILKLVMLGVLMFVWVDRVLPENAWLFWPMFFLLAGAFYCSVLEFLGEEG